MDWVGNMNRYETADDGFRASLSPLFNSVTVDCFGRQCSKNHAPWEVVKMDNIFNLSDAFQYKDVSINL